MLTKKRSVFYCKIWGSEQKFVFSLVTDEDIYFIYLHPIFAEMGYFPQIN